MCSACVREAIYGVMSVEFPKGGFKYSEIFIAFEGCENASVSLHTKAIAVRLEHPRRTRAGRKKLQQPG